MEKIIPYRTLTRMVLYSTIRETDKSLSGKEAWHGDQNRFFDLPHRSGAGPCVPASAEKERH